MADNILNVSTLSLYMYKLTGVVQFSTGKKDTWTDRILAFLLPLPFFIAFAYTSYDRLSDSIHDLFTSLDSIKTLDILYTANGIGRYLCYFYASFQLRSLILKIRSTDEIFKEYGDACNQNKLKLITCALGILFVTVNTITIGRDYTRKYFSYWVSTVDAVFISDVIFDLKMKYCVINKKISSYKTPVDLKKIFPSTKENTLVKLKTDDKDFHMTLLEDLSQWHYKLTDYSIKFNDLVAYPLLLSLGITFAALAAHPYNIFQKFKNGVVMENLTWVIFQKSSHFVFHFWRTCFIINCWTSLSKTANYTATLVHDVWNKYAILGEADTKIQHLELISVRHLNTRLQFSAKGFFPVDWSLLHLIVGAVTTYVIILIQFEI